MPVGMASLPDGRVYALVQTDRVVWQETPGSAKGRRLTTIKGDCPQAMAAGTEALWVLSWPDCSSGNSRVIRIDPATGNQQPGNLLGGWGQAIATGLERSYGVLKRLGASPLPRSILLSGKTLAVPLTAAEIPAGKVEVTVQNLNPAGSAAVTTVEFVLAAPKP